MSIPTRNWTCIRCGRIETQTGPRALEMIPTPPEGWMVLTMVWVDPPRVSGEGAGKVKIGASRDFVSYEFCACLPRDQVWPRLRASAASP